ncbi:hypothetical protein ASPZODRAFT_20257 [Penicilliopsis zonata CBS 506.65]|uniref:Uncharacterized protein n=1 Tax=Penicilliopsis zonata CBS 506.65 TaxID=1073090 RepID=A0A1L9S6E5_9EURO|nr:hypothetical protein ASPZODRAFT_20257 [Penicilliopsis zonata CBS 506.65]OJJ42732.1 hypothetical protein ASPZODRAFT_20257 [Penicilliopsis zonata CBS 506.65]
MKPYSITACWNRYTFAKAFTLLGDSPRERILADFVIPKDMIVIVDAIAGNFHNPFWGPDSHAYQPSQFAGMKPNKLRILKPTL